MSPLPLPGERLVRGGALEHLDGGRGQLLHSLDVGGDLLIRGWHLINDYERFDNN